MFVETKREGESEAKTLERWRQILINAADKIEKYGWIQGSLVTNRGVCVLGALGGWGMAEGYECDANRKLLAHINLSSPDNPWSLAAWNDEPGRTKAEVLTALREAARG
jgi:hypothetical protein